MREHIGVNNQRICLISFIVWEQLSIPASDLPRDRGAFQLRSSELPRSHGAFRWPILQRGRSFARTIFASLGGPPQDLPTSLKVGVCIVLSGETSAKFIVFISGAVLIIEAFFNASL